MKWQCFCQTFDVALGDVSGGPLRSCAPGYGSVRLVSVGHYPAGGIRLATSIPAANYAGIQEEEMVFKIWFSYRSNFWNSGNSSILR